MIGRSQEKVNKMLTDAEPDLLAFGSFPRRHRRQICSTNPLEWVFGYQTPHRRRYRVPQPISRLAASAMIEQHDAREGGACRYFSTTTMLELAAINTHADIADGAASLPKLTAA